MESATGFNRCWSRYRPTLTSVTVGVWRHFWHPTQKKFQTKFDEKENEGKTITLTERLKNDKIEAGSFFILFLF